MELIVALVGLPCIAALLMLVIRGNKARDVVAVTTAIVIGVLSVVFAIVYLGAGTTYLALPESFAPALGIVNFLIEIAVGAFILAYAVRYKRMLALALALIQLVMAVWIEVSVLAGHEFSTQMRIDELTVIMTLIIGIVGSGICVYALGYMKDFQSHHADGKDRRPWFFALMFAFLAAMFNIVFSDNMAWIYTAWEVTTLCSFLLIGFTKTDEAIGNAFRQIVMNMLGGIAFQVAIAFAAINGLPLVFSEFLMAGAMSAGTAAAALFAIPVVLLAFAGMTKAAQMPFHTWLLGAMVAPTPTSALLHSSTMVKAGVFLLIKLSPLFLVFPAASAMVVLVGGFTFLFCSLLAISQSNAKRVLAYSTIANLGLITACAGVGTPEAVWAAIFLVVFHAVAKSLLFLCVGTAEHHIGSRNIEDMDELFERMPRLARFMMLGIMCMFIAPFGMLVSKWATLVSFATTGQVVLLVLLAFGSAATFMFWGKWLGKLAGIAAHRDNIETTVHKSEWAAIVLMAVLVVLCCVGMPAISLACVEPYILGVYNAPVFAIGFDNMAIMAIIVAFIVVVLFGTLGHSRKKTVPVYMAGITIDSAKRVFRGSLGGEREASSRNWYLENIFGEKRLDKPATVLTAAIIIVFVCASVAACWLSAGFGAVSLPMYLQTTPLNESVFSTLIGIVAFLVLGPVIGCLLAGLDRIISARMQGRVGPPLLQPYYDVRKLIAKDDVSVNTVEGTYITCALVFTLIAGGVFFGGGNFLMCVFLVTLSALFFILAAYSSRSPYAEIGADREILQVMSYEPMILFVAVGMLLTLGTFDVAGAFSSTAPMIVAAWPIFIGLLFVLTIKLRKSPFDLSYSHHAHQELVKGVTTEMSGRTLAKVEIMHWCENVLFIAWVALFFVWSNPFSILLAIAVALAVYFLEIWIDNNFARVKWQSCLKWAWIVSFAAGLVNIAGLVLYIVFM
ncbi:MAG: proton-conducting transporter membrane subunit [Slackia sp.]|nr:proton-conducting transporter membrane subunit [Slackia sp.]